MRSFVECDHDNIYPSYSANCSKPVVLHSIFLLMELELHCNFFTDAMYPRRFLSSRSAQLWHS